ncbi:MAG TPA: hypothetical protein VM890_09880 [Longimicrobium sp.]|jgi:hypothetical protein|nr:hypothetical protein [Longimicrobium sp.]
MLRVTIQQFHAALVGADRGGPMRGYRELTRHPDLAAETRHADWVLWAEAPAASTARAAGAYRALTRRPDLAAGMRRTEWNVWTQMAAPPAIA